MPTRSSDGTAGRHRRTRFFLSLVVIAGASYYGARLGASSGGRVEGERSGVVASLSGMAPSGQTYAEPFRGELMDSDRCSNTVARLKRALPVQFVGLTPSGEIARFNDRWFADVRVSCPPRPAAWMSGEHAEIPPNAVVMAADYGAVVFGVALDDLAGTIGDACRMAQNSAADDRHGDVEKKDYAVSCDQPPSRDGYLISINTP